MNRRMLVRSFVGGAVLTGSALDAQSGQLAWPAKTRRGDRLYRGFGKTGETASVIGVGGSHIGQTSPDELAICGDSVAVFGTGRVGLSFGV
jgi:hypothetical protein